MFKTQIFGKWGRFFFFLSTFCCRGLFILNYHIFSCFGDKNSPGARLQIDDVLSTSKQRKCFWNQIKAFFEWLPAPFKSPFSRAALALIKAQTPHSLFKSIRFYRRWRKWVICNIHELGTSQVWPLSEWLYNCSGCVLHNRHSQAPNAPIKPNLVSESKRPYLHPHPLPSPSHSWFLLDTHIPRKKNTAWSLKWVYQTERKDLDNTSSSRLTELKCVFVHSIGLFFSLIRAKSCWIIRTKLK